MSSRLITSVYGLSPKMVGPDCLILVGLHEKPAPAAAGRCPWTGPPQSSRSRTIATVREKESHLQEKLRFYGPPKVHYPLYCGQDLKAIVHHLIQIGLPSYAARLPLHALACWFLYPVQDCSCGSQQWGDSEQPTMLLGASIGSALYCTVVLYYCNSVVL